MYKYIVYKHISPSNKIYIGITCRTPEKRWINGNGYKHNLYFTNSIKLYGWNSFTHEVLFENLTKDDAENLEILLISKYKSNMREFGYNLTAGGGGRNSYKHSEETKIKIGNANRGNVHTEEQKEVTRKVMKDKYLNDEEYRNHLNNVNVGRIPSKETIEKYKLRNNKKVIQYSKDGIELCRYSKIKEAGDSTGINPRSISANCKGKLKSAGGYIWKYDLKEEQEETNSTSTETI